MALIIDNDGVKFLEEIKPIFNKYVHSASLASLEFADGTKIGMRTFLRFALGHITLRDCIC